MIVIGPIMKVLLILTALAAVNCELPPPIYHQPQTYKPNPQLDFNQRPQQSLDVKIPSKFTIEQLIRLTEQLQHTNRYSGQRIQVNLHQGGYQPNQLKPPSKPPVWQNFQPGQPDKNQWVPQPSQPNQRPVRPPSWVSQQVRPSQPLRPPSTNYGVPDFGGVETFEDDSNKQQNPPYNKPPVVFRPTQEYVPPQSTQRVPTTTTPRVPEVVTLRPDFESFDGPVTQQTPASGGDAEGDPNIAISNAVAGTGSFFYLQQPDGRLQRVVLQKLKDPNGKPEEYVANYYFQNIQALPNVVYTPLISLGELRQD